LSLFRWSTAVGLLVAALLVVPARASDHLDSPSVIAAPEADLTDLYTWVDGNQVVLALGVTPFATPMSQFSDKVQYVFHTASTDKFTGGATPIPVDVICTFDLAQNVSCWVGTADFVSGDASATTGLTSTSGKVKVFAGLRDDPAFFNLDGFKSTVNHLAGSVFMVDASGCPAFSAATSAAVVQSLSTDPNSAPPGGLAKDYFAGKNVLALVVSVDKTLLTTGGALVSVWASTNKGM
jgi:hypothetical protein